MTSMSHWDRQSCPIQGTLGKYKDVTQPGLTLRFTQGVRENISLFKLLVLQIGQDSSLMDNGNLHVVYLNPAPQA